MGIFDQQKYPFGASPDDVGNGMIYLKSFKKRGQIITQSQHQFDNLNTEGAISELKKIIKNLEKDLKK